MSLKRHRWSLSSKERINRMRKIINLNQEWFFSKLSCDIKDVDTIEKEKINLPHTWNAFDGQDGGMDYYRGQCWYHKLIQIEKLKDDELAYLEFNGVNSSCDIYINKKNVFHHDGGYSTFRVNVTDYIKDNAIDLNVLVDNKENDNTYPQTADFTFYGGIYRDVNLIIVNKNHFDLDYFGGPGVKITPRVQGNNGVLSVTPYIEGNGEVTIQLFDQEGHLIIETKEEKFIVENVRLWQGLKDPYLYKVVVLLKDQKGHVLDEVSKNIGFRYFSVDHNKGFFLNGESYPLRGVCRHQDLKDVGNAVKKEHHDHDMALIKEIGANTVRLAHYQHDDYTLDLCDKLGLIIWAEVPYISKHLDNGNENIENQLKELIIQQYHHPSIVVWGISNEITMFKKGRKKQFMEENIKLNKLAHELDDTRLTTMACFSMCGPLNKVAKITDVTSWNLYFGWYVPFKFLNKLWFGFYRLFNHKRCVGMSEYGAEAMINLHSNHPHVGDSTEEYQADYHEYMLNFYAKRPYFWATHIWNMFDFGSDGRNHGGDPGVNHKGLVTFDHQTKKDSFYVCKAYWSEEPFVYIAGKRFAKRDKKNMVVKVYSNQKEVSLYSNDKLVATKKSEHVFKFKVKVNEEIHLKAVSGECVDEATFTKVDKFPEEYKLHAKSNNYSWEK